MLRRVTPETLDHVALWVADRDRIADFATSRLGMHVVDRTDAFTLVGSDARRGKLTLFAAEGPREQGALKHVALRVSSLAAALGSLDGTQVERPREGEAYMDVSEGLRLGLVEAPTEVEYDLDHVALSVAFARGDGARRIAQLGFSSAAPGPSGAPRVEVGGAFVEFHQGEPGEPERPLLNHLAVLVESAEEHIAEAASSGSRSTTSSTPPNTYAVFVWGPERVKIEYVEHKPTFSLT